LKHELLLIVLFSVLFTIEWNGLACHRAHIGLLVNVAVTTIRVLMLRGISLHFLDGISQLLARLLHNEVFLNHELLFTFFVLTASLAARTALMVVIWLVKLVLTHRQLSQISHLFAFFVRVAVVRRGELIDLLLGLGTAAHLLLKRLFGCELPF
jgi:hypothetical protein